MRLSNRLPSLIGLMVFSAVFLGGCDSSSDNMIKKSAISTGIDISMFAKDAFTEAPKIVDCETAQGTATTCYQFVTSGAPAGRVPGPFCPRTISDGADVTGGWFSKDGTGDLIDLTGNFILMLGEYYGDEKWMLYDAKTKKIRYTATKAACSGAARPDVEEQYKQNCIECELTYLDDDFSLTYLIPTTPIPGAETARVHTVGIALDGTELSGPAPINAILGSYTIAAFDDCGGHINLHQGYHYHSTTGCTNAVASEDGHASLIGYAVDGYGIYAMRDAQGKEESLDQCRGTTDETRGYHYHAATPSENMFIGCLHGEAVSSGDGPPDGPPGDRPPPEGAPPAGGHLSAGGPSNHG
ncbi:YHYH protein [Paraglaciecola sp. 20A4]|uniref:YHYH protein n=1 Tax=Paraglaciecola sp. 20A4 TaxID=2687288 RepID=UPI00140C7D69|nr:YHYH protein [Paraglaciecola sp. 20A4]